MASRTVIRVLALVLLVAVAAGGWWLQNRSGKGAGEQTAAAPAAGGTGAGGGAGSPAGVGAPAGAGGPGAAPGAAPGGAGRPGGGGKPAVEVAVVEQSRLLDEAQSVGNLRSRQNVTVRPEVSGRITQINFRDGQRVSKGQLLVQLDDQLAQAQIKQAEAELSIARANFNRNKELVEQNFISRRTVDESAANLEVAQAKLTLAKATAERLKILAPFDGSVGIRSINLGDYLKDGADVVNLEDMDAIYVDYRLPERFQTRLRTGLKAQVEVDALPGRQFSAVVLAIDPLIDSNGRSVGVRACIDNRRMQLRPGMFARVGTVFAQRDKALMVPEEAIVPQGGRQFVIRLIDGAEGKVTQRVEVRVGLRIPGKAEILSGLKAGDVVVVAGQQRLQREGTEVRVIESAAGRPGGPSGPGGPGGTGGPGGPGGPGAGAAGGGGPGGAPGARPPGPARAAAPQAALQGPDPCLQAGQPGGGPAGGRPSTGRAPA